MTLPPPSVLLSHPKFESWYPGQDRAFSSILSWLNGPSRFLCASMPTGAGKSVLAVLASYIGNRRTALLTVTKGLQAQMLNDFYQNPGMEDIRGQNNYQCTLLNDRNVTADEGPCHAGVYCQFKESGGCPYYDQLFVAKSSRIFVTNYSYFLAQSHFSDGIGPPYSASRDG